MGKINKYCCSCEHFLDLQVMGRVCSRWQPAILVPYNWDAPPPCGFDNYPMNICVICGHIGKDIYFITKDNKKYCTGCKNI